MTDNKEMTIEDRAGKLYPGPTWDDPNAVPNRLRREGFIKGFTSCQQLYGGLTPEQVREAIELLKRFNKVAALCQSTASIDLEVELLLISIKEQHETLHLSKDETPKQ